MTKALNRVYIGIGAAVSLFAAIALYRKFSKKKVVSNNPLLKFHPDFHECCLLVGRVIGKLSVEDQLYFYSLFKQITQGDCTLPAPSKVDVVELRKWEAWNSLLGMPQDEAMDAYFSAAMNLPDELTAPHKLWAENEMLRQRLGDDAPELDYDNLDELPDGPNGGDGMGAGPSKMMGQHADPFGEADQEVTAMDDGIEKFCRLLSSHRVPEALALLKVDAQLAKGYDSNHCTALHWAADSGSVEACEALIAAGAELDAEDADGETPLSTAVLSEQIEVVKLLLDKGARTDLPEGDDSAADRGRLASDKQLRELFGF